jgi:hypothetical protein
MSLNLFFNEPCPKCRKPIMQGAVEPHPTRRDIALENFVCADCGPVKTKIISLLWMELRPGDQGVQF